MYGPASPGTFATDVSDASGGGARSALQDFYDRNGEFVSYGSE